MNSSNSYKIHRLAIEMDKVADQVLQKHLGISYRRFYFLLVLERNKYSTQHMLAEALGYSDPAVSNMILELRKDNYVVVELDPHHGRRRIVTITPKGKGLVRKAMVALDECFSQLAALANIDEDKYGSETEILINMMIRKRKENL